MWNFIKSFSIPVILSLGAVAVAQANKELLVLEKDAKQWVMPTGNYANHRYSELSGIDRNNVKDLKVAWTFPTGVLHDHEGGPLIIGDLMYLHTPFPNKVVALDLNKPAGIVWEYVPVPDKRLSVAMRHDASNRGLAYAGDTVFLYRADAVLVALNARSGELRWEVSNGDIAKGETGVAAPMVVGNKVYVGISGSKSGVRGHLTAYDVATGKRIWRGYSTGSDTDTLMGPDTTYLGQSVGVDSGLESSRGVEWKTGGGTTGGWYAYDPDLDLIYYGSGNSGARDPRLGGQRLGDQRWSASIFARDADTGMAKWVYQMTPQNEWGFGGVDEMILADINIERRIRKALVHLDSNGFGYTLDRETGQLLVAEKFDPAVNWASHVDLKTGRPQPIGEHSTRDHGEQGDTRVVCPSAAGAKNQQPAAFSPDIGIFYVPVNHECMDAQPSAAAYKPGQPSVGAAMQKHPKPGSHRMGSLIAWDAGRGKVFWSIPERSSVLGGTLATAGGIVFYATLEGYLKAIDAETGEELYQFKAASRIVGNVTTYEHDGKQYVAVLSGGAGGSSLLVFSL